MIAFLSIPADLACSKHGKSKVVGGKAGHAPIWAMGDMVSSAALKSNEAPTELRQTHVLNVAGLGSMRVIAVLRKVNAANIRDLGNR